MNMYKICTSKEQSKKLIELGIDVNTADMFWTYDFIVNDINGINVISNKFKPEENDIPAWSLAALLNVLPKIDGLRPIMDLEEVSLYYTKADLYVTATNPLDACYEMILKLKEKNLL